MRPRVAVPVRADTCPFNSVYALVDPRTEMPRYVGITRKTPAHRLQEHLYEARRGGQWRRCRWIRQLLSAGLEPEIRLIETVSDEARQGRERFWIATARQMGLDLTNLTDGGEGRVGYHCPAEVRARMSAAQRGKVIPPSVREKLRAANLGKPGRVRPPEEIDRQRGDRNWTRQRPEDVLRGSANSNARLTEEQVLTIRHRYQPRSVGLDALASQYGVTNAQIWNILTGRAWKHVGGPLRQSTPNAPLSPDQVREIRRQYVACEWGCKARLAAEFGVSESTILGVANGTRYKKVI